MTAYILILIIILLLIWWFQSEHYRSCRDCEGGVAANGTAVLNPFVWPYSGTGCVDDLYMLGKDSGVEIGTGKGPLVSPNAPDHVVLTN
jgi:hypothetical protein